MGAIFEEFIVWGFMVFCNMINRAFVFLYIKIRYTTDHCYVQYVKIVHNISVNGDENLCLSHNMINTLCFVPTSCFYLTK